MPSNRFDQICGCGERVSLCPFWRAVKRDTGVERYSDHTRTMLPQYRPGGWRGVVEHSLRYRLYHARTQQAARHAERSLALSYEGLANDIDGELTRLFCFFDVEPMTVEQLRPYFGQEWHFMGNSSLFQFDGVIRHSQHDMGKTRERWIRRIAGEGWKRG